MASMTLDKAPDGGYRAWLVVFGSWCCNVIISGWLNALGVFQDYYSATLFPTLPESTVAIIPALVDFVIFAGVSPSTVEPSGIRGPRHIFADLRLLFQQGPVFGLLYDRYGPRVLLAVGASLHVIGVLAASFAGDRFYALVLSQGVCEETPTRRVPYNSSRPLAYEFNRI